MNWEILIAAVLGSVITLVGNYFSHRNELKKIAQVQVFELEKLKETQKYEQSKYKYNSLLESAIRTYEKSSETIGKDSDDIIYPVEYNVLIFSKITEFIEHSDWTEEKMDKLLLEIHSIRREYKLRLEHEKEFGL